MSNTLKARFGELTKEMASLYGRHLDWVASISWAYRSRTGHALKPDDEFAPEDEDLARKIMCAEDSNVVQ